MFGQREEESSADIGRSLMAVATVIGDLHNMRDVRAVLYLRRQNMKAHAASCRDGESYVQEAMRALAAAISPAAQDAFVQAVHVPGNIRNTYSHVTEAEHAQAVFCCLDAIQGLLDKQPGRESSSLDSLPVMLSAVLAVLERSCGADGCRQENRSNVIKYKYLK